MSKLLRLAPPLFTLRRSLSTTLLRASTSAVAPDPWPLPLSPGTVAREQYVPQRLSDDPESWDMPKPLNRTGEDESTLRARLVYQTRKRGCLEGDLLLSTYAKERLPTMNMKEMQEFDKVSHIQGGSRSRSQRCEVPTMRSHLQCIVIDCC